MMVFYPQLLGGVYLIVCGTMLRQVFPDLRTAGPIGESSEMGILFIIVPRLVTHILSK